MSELRDKALAAARQIIGNVCFDAMIKCKVNTLTLLNSAAHTAFVEEHKGEHVEDLRKALKVLDQEGKL